jgi:phosphoglycerol transferase
MAKKKRNKSGNPAAGSVQTLPSVKPAAPVAQSTYSVAGSSKASTGFYNTVWFEWLSIAVVSALSFWFLTARIVGVQVSVLADEYLYVLDAHYNGLPTAKYPNYLFQLIYGSTKMCGSEFYSCARSINAFFVIFGAVFIYLLAKHIGRSKLLAALASIAAILGSYGTYTAYFMPEAIFNGLIMVFFWAIIRFGKTDNLLVWAAIGSSLGIAALAKPHGLFVVPAVVIFIVLWTRAAKEQYLVSALFRTISFVAAVVGSKTLIGYILAGERALPLFGMYGTLETATQTATETIAAAGGEGTSVFFTAWGQVLMITMILGLALPIAVHGLLLSLRKDPVTIEAVKFRSLMGLSLLSLMPAIAIFEAWQSLGPWMHTRYYTYLLPLSLIVLIEAYRNQEPKFWPWAKYSVIAIFLGLAGFNLFTAAIPYVSNWIDGPDFRMHMDNLVVSSVSILGAIVASVIWVWRIKVAVAIALILAFALSVFSGAHTTTFLKTTFGYEMAYEHLARVLSGYVPQAELDRAVMIGQFEMVQRTVFSSMTGTMEVRHPVDVLSRADVDPSKAWLITIGDQVVEGFGEPTVTNEGYKLYSLNPLNELKPRSQTIETVTNNCPNNSDQGWSCGTETSVFFNSSFPANASVDFIFEVSEWAAGKELEFTLGDAVLIGQFEKGIASVFGKFTNSSSAESLIIRVKSDSTEESQEAVRLIRPIWGNSKVAIVPGG